MDLPTIHSIYPAELRDQSLTVLNKTLHIRASWNAKQVAIIIIIIIIIILFSKRMGPVAQSV